MEYKFIENAVELELSNKGKYTKVIEEWLKTNNKTLEFSCTNTSEMRSCAGACRIYKKNNNLDYTIYTRGVANKIYLVRA